MFNFVDTSHFAHFVLEGVEGVTFNFNNSHNRWFLHFGLCLLSKNQLRRFNSPNSRNLSFQSHYSDVCDLRFVKIRVSD